MTSESSDPLLEGAQGRSAVKSAERVLDVLELLSSSGRGMTHRQIAQALGIPKGSLTKLLQTLIERHFVELTPGERTHVLGPALFAVADRRDHLRVLIAAATPALRELTRRLNESTSLNCLHGRESEVVATVMGSQRLVSQLRMGDLAPLHAVSGGKAMLADFADHEIDDYVESASFSPFTPNSIVSATDLRGELELARRRGFATSDEEYTPGIFGIAVPLRLPAPYPPSSINVAIPAIRATDAVQRGALDALRSAAQTIAAELAG